jgi:hypothetical protein
MSARPVYIPPGKRKSSNNPQRFHGAFTGGFSAGYFNTVDTKEGWKPSTDQRKDQRLEDFMDDQDHVEWGGPTKVRQDYNNNTKNDDVATNHAAQKEPLDSLFTISHQSIGPQLLRRLGWREGGGAAFVPLSQDEQHHQSKKEDDEETIIVLSKKRLKKIELQTKRIQIPPPKLDACGLGFAPHKDAPEFRQYQERRKQLARERGMGGGSNHNVYRTSTIMTETNKGELAQTDKKSSDNTQNTDDYLSHETAEDFVGKLSVGGFALRDDEDDAYDNRHASHARKPTQMNLGEEYNMEIYEHHESDEEDTGQGIVSLDPSKTIGNNGGLRQTKTDLGGILSSWANTSSTSNQKSVALTSDGRPPLEGFVLGGSMESHKKRYPGPDMPREYMVKRHVFGENEHPLIFQTIARAVQLQEREQQRQKFHKHQQQPLVAGGTFSNLGNAMKIRFTSSKKEESEGPERAGLYKPDPVVLAKQPEEETPSNEPLVTKKPIVLQRTVQSFLPHPLLCKRFGVPIPKNSMGSSFASSAMISHVPGRVTEANYFETEILAARNTDKQAKNESKQKGSDARGDDAKADDNDKVEKEDPTVIQRPSMVKLKSIYEPESDSESSTDLDASSDDEGKESEKEPTQKDTDLDASNDGEVKESEKEPAQKDEENQDANDSSASSLASDSRQRERHRRKKSHRRHSKKRRKRSRSPGDSEDDRRRRKERRRKHDRKQRKQSSRRKKDKDP